MAVDYQELLRTSTTVADEIVKTVDKLEIWCAGSGSPLRRAAEHDGSRTNPFSTQATVSTPCCALA